MRWLLWAIIVSAIMLANGGYLESNGKWFLHIPSELRIQRELCAVSYVGFEHVVIINVSEDVTEELTAGYFCDFVPRKSAYRRHTAFGGNYLGEVLLNPLMKESPWLNEPSLRGGAPYKEFETLGSRATTIYQRNNIENNAPDRWISVICENNFGIAGINECALAYNQRLVGGYPLLATVPRGKAGCDSGGYHKQERPNVEPMLGLGLGPR
jgi:hypothetical protein